MARLHVNARDKVKGANVAYNHSDVASTNDNTPFINTNTPISRIDKSNRKADKAVSSNYKLMPIASVLVIFLTLLIGVSLYRILANPAANPLTLAGLLDCFQSCPNIVVQPFTMFTIYDDWSIFNFLRDFINTLGQITSFSIYIISCILQLLVFIWHFLTYFFFITPSQDLQNLSDNSQTVTALLSVI